MQGIAGIMEACVRNHLTILSEFMHVHFTNYGVVAKMLQLRARIQHLSPAFFQPNNWLLDPLQICDMCVPQGVDYTLHCKLHMQALLMNAVIKPHALTRREKSV